MLSYSVDLPWDFVQAQPVKIINFKGEQITRNLYITEQKEKEEAGMNNWITIDFKNGEICHYRPNEYTDYQYDGKYFIVIRDKQWIGFYNLDEIRWIEISTKEEAERNKKENPYYTF